MSIFIQDYQHNLDFYIVETIPDASIQYYFLIPVSFKRFDIFKDKCLIPLNKASGVNRNPSIISLLKSITYFDDNLEISRIETYRPGKKYPFTIFK